MAKNLDPREAGEDFSSNKSRIRGGISLTCFCGSVYIF